MKVLLTGGTGFVGRCLTQSLVARGDEVTILTRDPRRSGQGIVASRVAAWDPMGGPPPAALIESSDAVVNLLGESIAKGRWTTAKKKKIRDSRQIGTRNLVAGIAAASPRPGVLVNGSAIGFYGARGDEPLDETSSAGSDFLAGVVRDWEEEASRAESLGVRVVCLRTGIVLGTGGGALQAMTLPFKLGVGGPVGSGKQWMSWIYISDLCGLILHALSTSELRGPLNGTAPNPVQNKDFAKVLGRVLGRPALMPTPGLMLRLLLGEMADALLLTGQKVVPKRAQETGFRFRYPALEEALREALGRRG